MNPERVQLPFPSILIVDDEPVTRMMVRQVLEEDGYIVLEAEDGNIGIDLCAQSRPDLVLMDVSMPNLDGFEACRTIHSNDATQHTPILMLTSLDDVQAVRLAFEAGATDFITKPINWALLSQRIRYALKARDIEWQLRASEGRLSDAHRIARLENWSVDVNEGQVTVSPGLGRILDLDSQLSHGLRAVMREFSRAERASLLQFMRAAMHDEVEREVEVRLHAEDSGMHWYYLSARAVSNDDGRRQSLIGIAQDVTERREAESRLNYLAHFDPLTGLPNRVLLYDRIGQAIADASRGGAAFAVVHVEIEEFSRFNASLGHAGSDQVLCAVATLLSASARTDDTVSNLGGNAFVMLLGDIDDERAGLRRVQRVLQVFDGPIEVAGREVLITTRIGVSVHPVDGESVEALLLHASAACARARELVVPYQFFTPRMHARASKRLEREVDLYRALERDEFALHFQPRVDLVSNKATSVEALLRWNHPVHGMVQPSDFIPMLEDMGLILDVGRWVVRRACQATRMLPVTVSVNVSPLELRHPDFMTNIQSVIEAETFPAERLELEITEQALMHDEHETSVVLRELRDAGVLISIDDYGAGYSSLRYLKQLPLDYLKIDRLFVGPMATDPIAAAIVRSTVDLCHDLGVSVVGEGAEDMETVTLLRTVKCDSVQGFAIARPMPVDQLTDWLAAPLSIESDQSRVVPRADNK